MRFRSGSTFPASLRVGITRANLVFKPGAGMELARVLNCGFWMGRPRQVLYPGCPGSVVLDRTFCMLAAKVRNFIHHAEILCGWAVRAQLELGKCSPSERCFSNSWRMRVATVSISPEAIRQISGARRSRLK